jgi:hypothetical protein
VCALWAVHAGRRTVQRVSVGVAGGSLRAAVSLLGGIETRAESGADVFGCLVRVRPSQDLEGRHHVRLTRLYFGMEDAGAHGVRMQRAGPLRVKR